MAATIFSVLLEIVRLGVVGSGRCWSNLESRHWSDLFGRVRPFCSRVGSSASLSVGCGFGGFIIYGHEFYEGWVSVLGCRGY